MAPTEELTEYERERLAKIERNKALMERLALAKLHHRRQQSTKRKRARANALASRSTCKLASAAS